MATVSRRALFCIFSLFLLPRLASCALTNRTIDDENGDSVTGLRPMYAPTTSAWNYGPTCPGCYVQPDIGDLFDQTWHDTTASPTDPDVKTITLTFNGTAIWVYCVVPNTVIYATTFVNISFELDGHEAGTYSHIPTTSDSFLYNVSVFSKTSLAPTQHTLVMTAERGVNASYLGFDWARYTFDSDPPSSSASGSTSGSTASYTPPATSTSSSSGIPTATSALASSSHPPVGAIVGGVVGGVAVIILILVAFLFWRRRGRRGVDRIHHNQPLSEAIEPLEPKFEPYVDNVTASHLSELPTTTTGPALTGMFSSSGVTWPGSSTTDTSAFAISSLPVAAPAPPSTVATDSTDASLPSTRAARGQSKATLRREELSRQMRDIERHVADLQRRQSSSLHASASTDPLMPTSRAVGHYDDTDLRRQIDDLQTEVERLRLEAAAAHEEPPPAYEEEGEAAEEVERTGD